jgi:hypothetical protein
VSVVLFLGLVPTAVAGPIEGNNGLSGLGSFEGTFDYSALDANNATLVIKLTNTSPEAGGGYLTGFVFNNPQGFITAASLVSTNSNFTLLGEAPFTGGVNGSPFGQFSLGAAVGGDFEGGGSPTGGIGVNASATFTFTFSGTGLNTLTEEELFTALSSPPGDGEGLKSFVARFRGFINGDSDKVPGTYTDPGVGVGVRAPEPSSLALAGIAVGCLLMSRFRSRRRGTPGEG